jgi:hypothetical protein
MKKLWPIILVILLGLSACSFGSPNNFSNSTNSGSSNNSDTANSKPSQNNEPSDSSENSTYEDFSLNLSTGPADLGNLKMSLAELGPFRSIFYLTFNGKQDWVYQVETRYDGALTEYSLHIEGLESSKNPGDIRLVNSNGINKMIGPGTDNVCMQFPDEMPTGALFLSPVDLVNPDALIQDWQIQENQLYLGRQTSRYTTAQDYYYGWEDVEVTFNIDSQSGAMLNYIFDTVGKDPLYDYGGGEIHGEFSVVEIGPQKILPVEGCEIPIPIPEDAYEIIILPGVFSYKSSLGPVKTDQFLTQELLPQGWGREAAEVNDDIREGFLTYISETQTLAVHVQAINPEDFSEGYLIRLYLEDK